MAAIILQKDVQEFLREQGISFPADPEEVTMERFVQMDKNQLKCFGFGETVCEQLLQTFPKIVKKDTRSRWNVPGHSTKPKSRAASARPLVLNSATDVAEAMNSPLVPHNYDQFFDELPPPTAAQRARANDPKQDLLLMVFLGHDDEVKAAVQATPEEVKKANSEGWTPLHYAMAIGCTTVAVALVDGGASLDARTNAGDTPLEMHGKERLEKWITVRDANDQQPAHHAAAARHHEACEVCLMFGGDPNAKDKRGDTPLHVACRLADLNTIEVLIASKHSWKKGNLHLKNNDGQTPTDVFPKDKTLLRDLAAKLKK
ncbi:Ankyrin-3-like protein [Aphelenchoides fujianensis]|nr:Ankyrin-3-like protein [Aphelenchoides fujianensis]